MTSALETQIKAALQPQHRIPGVSTADELHNALARLEYAQAVLRLVRDELAKAESVPREPTMGMMVAGVDAFMRTDSHASDEVYGRDIVAVWQAMYDAALKGQR